MRRLVGVLTFIAALLPSPLLAQATPSPGATPVASPAASGAAAYCASVGGIVRTRTPVLGTNDPATQIRLAGAREFCEFTGGAGAEPATSWISVDLDTLYAEQPTLAALAYLTKPPLPQTTGGANPASVYCASLGGAEIGAKTGAGGGWVTDDSDTPIDVLEACAFGDGSIIDSWGIAYHTNGTIRGADLTKRFRYQSANPPHVFGS
jgi:putative hemolysin